MLEWYVSQLWLLVKIVGMLFIIYELVKVVVLDVKKEQNKRRKNRNRR